MTNQYRDFTDKKISTLFWQYALPAIIGTSVNTLYNIIDATLIGHFIGREALSATGLILPIMNFATAIGVLVGVGSASRISILLGQKAYDKAEKLVGTSFMLSLLLSGSALLTMLYFIDPLLYFVGASNVTHSYAKDFLEIFLPGSLFLTLAFNFNNMMRACGFPFKAMITMFISVIANIILAPIFIIIFDMGMQGAAIATTISMIISFLFVMHHFTNKKSTIRLYWHNIRLDLDSIKGILSIGMSPFAMQLAASVIVVFINWQLNNYAPISHINSDDAIAAYANANRLITLIIMIVIGVNQGMQPIVGYNYGCKNLKRVKETFFYAVKVATAITSIGFLLGMFFPHILVSAFSSDQDMIDLSSVALNFVTAAYVFVGFQMVTTSFFQCIGMATISIILSLSRQVLILLPMLYILPLFLGVNGVWAAPPISDFLSTALAYIAIYWYFKSINKRHGLNKVPKTSNNKPQK
ncbi:MATE family efflux transporter [Frischella perrara]|uniref:Multidrug export protein MepA n=1 Tax=Frischella perrara TaxID=1267021 RepID=A0A0A7S763_FRIPE|nr:MATE family efflux transporter [Frischella perrara]AJA45096.1 putative efflux protein, MATE family [Frischella perrara]PWV66117.1 putative MATE family efflux protein [Frischella perrara]